MKWILKFCQTTLLLKQSIFYKKLEMHRGYNSVLQQADTNKKKGKPTLDREEFVQFYNKLTERPEIEELYMK